MSNKIELNAAARSDMGKGASRRLRHAGQTPAIVYGAGEPVSITLPQKDLWKAQEAEAFYSSILSLNIDGQSTDVIIKDLQRHPAKPVILHADFQRVDANAPIIVNVPLHFVNTASCYGVKMQGGAVQVLTHNIRVRCLPGQLPEYLVVDMQEARANDIIHISDVKMPEGVSSVDLNRGEDYDLALAQVNPPRGGLKG